MTPRTQRASYLPGLGAAVVKGIQVIKRRLEELASAEGMWVGSREGAPHGTPIGAHLSANSLDTCPEDVLYETELEDMCEQDPSTWEDLASQRWQEYSHFPGATLDSTTGEILDPAKVKAGCDEVLGFMSHMHVWDKVTREQAQSDPDGKIVEPAGCSSRRVTRSDADLSPKSSRAATRERISMPGLPPFRPPGISSPTVCREDGRASDSSFWWLM